MAQTIASIQGVTYRETPPFVYELPSRSTGDASLVTRAVAGESPLPSDAVHLIARIPQSTDSKPAEKRQEDPSPSGDAKANGEDAKASAAEQWELEELRETDRRVRAHERAHMCAGGGLVRGGVTYQFKTGPDGQRYAVGGEVELDTSPVNGNPGATKRKAERIRRAALAPADPSPQDRHVAAQAEAMASRASQEQVQAKMGTGPKTDGAPTVLSPDAMPLDRVSAVDTQPKRSPADAKSEGSAPGKPAPEEQAHDLAPAQAPEEERANDLLPHISAAFAGQGLPAAFAYRSPTALAAKARLNVLA